MMGRPQRVTANDVARKHVQLLDRLLQLAEESAVRLQAIDQRTEAIQRRLDAPAGGRP